MARNGKHNERKTGHALKLRRHRVFQKWSVGIPQNQIAHEEDLSGAQISRDLDAVLAELHGRGLDDSDRHRLEMLGKLAHAETELLAAWERSKQPKERRTTKTVRPDAKSKAGARDEGGKVTEGRDGNPKFIAELRALWESKASILNLLSPTRHEHAGPGGSAIPISIIEVVRDASGRSD